MLPVYFPSFSTFWSHIGNAFQAPTLALSNAPRMSKISGKLAEIDPFLFFYMNLSWLYTIVTTVLWSHYEICPWPAKGSDFARVPGQFLSVKVGRALKETYILKINTEMENAQGHARRPKRIYAVEKCRFSHFVITVGYPFCTNFLQRFLMEKCTFVASLLFYVDFYFPLL